MPTGPNPPWQQLPATLNDLGGFFSWQVETEGLVPLAELLREQELSARIAAVRSALAEGSGLHTDAVYPQVAVSAVQVGLVSRLWSVALAASVLHGWVPDLSTGLLVAGRGHRSPVAVASTVAKRGRTVRGSRESAAAIAELVLATSVTDVGAACADVGRTAPQVLRSNAASSLVAAARVLSDKRPSAARAADAIVRLLLDERPLALGGGYTEAGGFRRRGCCLYYRLPGHGLCTDCVLVRPGRPASDHH